MSRKYKDYFDPKKQKILDKYIGIRFGIYSPLLHEIFQRRQHEFDIPIKQFEAEVKKFCKNVKWIAFMKDLEYENNVVGGFYGNIHVIGFNKKALIKSLNEKKLYSSMKSFFSTVTHEVYHAIANHGDHCGIERREGKKIHDVVMNEIVTEMAASRTSIPIKKLEIERGRQKTDGYQKFTPFGNLIATAFGVSEKEFLRAGIQNRTEFEKVVFSNIPQENDIARVRTELMYSKYKTLLDVLYNGIELKKEHAIIQNALQGIFESGFSIAQEQVKSDNRKLTPEYLSELNYRYNKMVQLHKDILKMYEKNISPESKKQMETVVSKEKFHTIVADINKVFWLQRVIKDKSVIDNLFILAKEGILQEKGYVILKRYGIDLNNLETVIVDEEGKFPVSEQYKKQVAHEEYDDGKIYDNKVVRKFTGKIFKRILLEDRIKKSLERATKKVTHLFRRLKNKNQKLIDSSGQVVYEKSIQEESEFDKRYRAQPTKLLILEQTQEEKKQKTQLNDEVIDVPKDNNQER